VTQNVKKKKITTRKDSNPTRDHTKLLQQTLHKKILPLTEDSRPIPPSNTLDPNDEFKMDTPTSSSFQYYTSEFSSNSAETGGVRLNFSPFRGGQSKEFSQRNFESSPEESGTAKVIHIRIMKDKEEEKETILNGTNPALDNFIQAISHIPFENFYDKIYVNIDSYVNTLETILQKQQK